MGSVWLASDAILDRDVAVKEVTFPVSLSDEERQSLRERTLREARAAARFQHPRVTTVHDVVEEDGRPWIVMEHVPSRSLSEVVRDRGTLPVAEVVGIGLDVLSALDAAHRAGIVHRDVKPANVLIDEHGDAWLTDFGIATSTGDDHLTVQGVVVGSPPYIAPERARGEEPGPPADLWALGATLYTAVTGRPPFDRGDAIATLLAVTNEEPPPAPGAGALEPVLEALLTKDPAARMTAAQARSALGRLRPADLPARPTLLPAEAGGGASEARRAPAPFDGGGGRPDRVDDVQRIDLGEIAAMAAAATKAVAGTAVRHAARRVRRGDAPEPPRRAAARGAPAPARDGRRRRRPPAEPERSTWRFKRRWVVVPVLVLLGLLLVTLLASAGVLLELVLDGD